MDILLLIKLRVDAEHLRAAADIGDGGLRRLLHDVAEVAGQLQLSGAVEHGGFNIEHFPADGCPGKAAHEADLILRIDVLRLKARGAEIVGHAACAQLHALALTERDALGRLAADGGQLEHAHAGFARIERDDLADGIVAHAQLRRLEPVLFALLRQQVLLCDLELFLVRIARELDDLHAVEQRARDGVKRVGRQDEKHIRQVDRDLHEVIAEVVVLLRIEHLQQRRRRVAAVIAAELIDLVEHHDGVHAAGDGQAVDDAARHGADIRLAVAADLRLVVYTAERDTRELAVRGVGNAHGNARLAGARRADKAQHAALDIGRELAHGQILRDAVLDLFEAEVLFVQHLARGAHVERFLRARVPRQLEADIQIIADDSRLR